MGAGWLFHYATVLSSSLLFMICCLLFMILSFIIIFAVYDPPQSVGESDNLCFHLKLNCRQLDLVGWLAAAGDDDDDDDDDDE